MNLKLDITPPTLPLSKGRSEEGLTEFVMNIKKKQLFPVDTKVSCPELFQDNRKCQVKADIIIKRREVNQETKVNRALRNGGTKPFIAFWRPAMFVAYLLQKENVPSHSKNQQLLFIKRGRR